MWSFKSPTLIVWQNNFLSIWRLRKQPGFKTGKQQHGIKKYRSTITLYLKMQFFWTILSSSVWGTAILDWVAQPRPIWTLCCEPWQDINYSYLPCCGELYKNELCYLLEVFNRCFWPNSVSFYAPKKEIIGIFHSWPIITVFLKSD